MVEVCLQTAAGEPECKAGAVAVLCAFVLVLPCLTWIKCQITSVGVLKENARGMEVFWRILVVF